MPSNGALTTMATSTRSPTLATTASGAHTHHRSIASAASGRRSRSRVIAVVLTRNASTTSGTIQIAAAAPTPTLCRPAVTTENGTDRMLVRPVRGFLLADADRDGRFGTWRRSQGRPPARSIAS